MRHALTAWREPLVTFIAMALAVGLVSIVAPTPGALVLAGVLTMTMSRNRLANSWRGRAEALVLLPVIALLTIGVGYLLKTMPLAGAFSFVAAMFVSIWLRRFGPIPTRIGTLIALPFVTLLLVPGISAGHSRYGALLIALTALVVVVAIRLVAIGSGFLAAEKPHLHEAPAKTSSALRPIASTRMALQLAIALTLAFAVGWSIFPGHDSWVVLTAFIVCSGNRGRVDVLYKSGLRVAGAIAGTLLAAGLGSLLPMADLSGFALTVSILVILGIGLWLRSWTYALWAFAMTLVASLLQGVISPLSYGDTTQLWLRVIAIVAGALCGLASSWFVLPVRSEPVVRRRLADALATLSAFLAERTPETQSQVEFALAGLNEIAPPWKSWDRVARPRQSLRRPGQWIRLAESSIEMALHSAEAPGSLRRLLGETRKALREPDAIGPALLALEEAFRTQLKPVLQSSEDGSMSQRESHA